MGTSVTVAPYTISVSLKGAGRRKEAKRHQPGALKVTAQGHRHIKRMGLNHKVIEHLPLPHCDTIPMGLYYDNTRSQLKELQDTYSI